MSRAHRVQALALDSPRVAMCIRSDYLERPGGDTVQLECTKNQLEQQFFLDIDVVTDPSALAGRQYALVHLFNVQQPENGMAFIRAAAGLGLPIVLSPIYWQMSDAQYARLWGRWGRLASGPLPSLLHPFWSLIRSTAASLLPRGISALTLERSVRDMISRVQYLLPNSFEELELLIALAPSAPPATVVPNGIATEVFTLAESLSSREAEGVCIIGRIEPLKNQAGLVAALMKTPEIRVGILGPEGIDAKYVSLVRKLSESRGNVELRIGKVDQAEVAQFMTKYKVHALPSFRESTGLVSLEALAVGRRVVVSSRRFCPTQTYFTSSTQFRHSVFVCNPYSLDSISSAVQSALRAQGSTAGDYVASVFTWAEAAKQTARGYEEVLGVRFRCRRPT